MEGFDVSQFENADSGSFNVLRQDGDEMEINGKPVVITMHGMGTKQQVSAAYKLSRATAASTVAAFQGKPGKKAEEEAFKRNAEYLAACTISIDNWPGEGGALGIYMNPKLGYITKQADEFLKDSANFMRSSTKS